MRVESQRSYESELGLWCWVLGRYDVSECQSVKDTTLCCSKIAEAEAAVSVNEKKLLVMHMHVQLTLHCTTV